MTYRTRNILIAVLLLAVGVIATSTYLKTQADRAARGQKLVEVLVARERIAAGTPADDLVGSDLVELRKVRSDDQVAGAITDAEALGDRAATATIYPGDQISARKFADTSELPATSQVTGTERLIALPVGRFQSVDGTLGTGDRVDIWASRTTNNETTTWVVARDVLVSEGPELGTDQASRSGSKRDFPVVTFRVSDVVAEQLIWSYAHSDDTGLVLAARPAEGAAQTKLKGERVSHA
jgi:Flp pilus assembly protein CpaB